MQSNTRDRALDAYTRYIKEFPRPVETAIEIRFKFAEMHKGHDEALYHNWSSQSISTRISWP